MSFLNGHAPGTSTSTTPAVRRAVLASIVMLLLGVVAGFVWLWLAEPAEVTTQGQFASEAASRGQFSVIVLFIGIGAIVCLAWSWGAAWVLEDLGWLLTPLVIALTSLAAVIAWRIGVELGPPDPATVTGASPGELVPSQLRVDAVAPFLVWPIFGLVGVVGAVWIKRRDVAASS